MRIEVLESAFDPWQEVAQYETSITGGTFVQPRCSSEPCATSMKAIQ